MAERFPETDWPQLFAFAAASEPGRREIFGRLVAQYWKPIYCYIRAMRKALAPEAAEDLTQEFFTTMLARDNFDRLTPDRGSFRGFLKTALHNFVTSVDRAGHARKRLFPIAEAEAVWQERPELQPDEAFDRAWARGVLMDAVGRLERELRQVGRDQQFEIFRAYCMRDEGAATYKEIALRFGVREDDVDNRLRESRRLLQRILRSMAARHAISGDALEGELRTILRQ